MTIKQQLREFFAESISPHTLTSICHVVFAYKKSESAVRKALYELVDEGFITKTKSRQPRRFSAKRATQEWSYQRKLPK